MRLNEDEMRNWYEAGCRAALMGVPPNFGHRQGKHSRYYEMAYHAGYHDASTAQRITAGHNG